MSLVEYIAARAIFTDEEFIQSLRSLGVPTIPESTLVVLERATLHHFQAVLYERMCWFCMAPFTSRTEDMQRFKDKLNCLVRLRGCTDIIQLVGFVTDCKEQHLRGYCCEAATMADIGDVLAIDSRIERPIPWSSRLQWMRSIVTAAAESHDRGIVIGLTGTIEIRVTPDHRVVLNTSFSYKPASRGRGSAVSQVCGVTSAKESCLRFTQ